MSTETDKPSQLAMSIANEFAPPDVCHTPRCEEQRRKLMRIIDEKLAKQWIPVSERLPEFNLPVWLCLESGKIIIGGRSDAEEVATAAFEAVCRQMHWVYPPNVKQSISGLIATHIAPILAARHAAEAERDALRAVVEKLAAWGGSPSWIAEAQRMAIKALAAAGDATGQG